MSPEFFNKFLIIYKEILQQLFQIWIRDLTDICGQFFIHPIDTFFCNRHIICRIIFFFIRFTDLFYINLKITVIIDHFTIYFYKIFLIVFCDSLRIGIPDFSIKRPCLILQKYIIIWFPISCFSRTLSFTQVNIPNCFSFM